MSLNFSAHQYDAAFKPRRLGNWEVPKTYPELPLFRKCQPEVIANDRGHLYPKYKCRRKNPFCNYIGTYALPRRITKDLAVKLGQFPRDYMVFNETLYTPCHVTQKCTRPAYKTDEREDAFRNLARKCIRENVDENMSPSEMRDELFLKRVKKCIDINSQATEEDSGNQQLRKIVRDCILEITNGKKDKIDENKLFMAVKECAARKLGDKEDRMEDALRKIVEQCMDSQLKGKDILKPNLKDQNVKDRVDEKLGQKKEPGQEKDKANKDERLRQKVIECINQIDSKEFDKVDVKDKIKKCVQKLKENEKKELDKDVTDDKLRDIVRQCIKENKRKDNDTTNSKEIKERIKDCVKKNMERNKEEKVRDTVKQCIAQLKSNDEKNLTESPEKDFKERVKKCVQGKEEKPEGNEKIDMRETVKECLKQHASDEKILNPTEFRDKVKRCAKENYNFRQAVRECIPGNFGKDDVEKKVKECAKEKMKDNEQGKGKEEFRGAVQECIKENMSMKKKKSDGEFKKIVKECALEKLKKK
ncbi:hypothetical protein M8J75_008274 [Diaphorina citri]|nr:hypothetical protein M8J75_008274 [Diaphorina citri]KAI5751666.1 hypothetical protein M8J77_009679 [Diaphorina citri]